MKTNTFVEAQSLVQRNNISRLLAIREVLGRVVGSVPDGKTNMEVNVGEG